MENKNQNKKKMITQRAYVEPESLKYFVLALKIVCQPLG